MEHFGDKILHCDGCKQDIHLPFNSVGGFWHLSGWKDKDGDRIYGGYCSECFGKMDDERKENNEIFKKTFM